MLLISRSKRRSEMNPFVRFMQTPTGRVTRVVGGGALIGAGLIGVAGVGGNIMTTLGVIPLAAGLFDFCVLAPLFRIPFSGAKIRAMR
jgi:hypothetical protein